MVQSVVINKKRKSIFGAALSGITSLFSIQAESMPRVVSMIFFLRHKFLYPGYRKTKRTNIMQHFVR